MQNKVALIILDGWGIAPESKINGISQANTPFINSLYKKYPHATLLTHGANVGLPDGQMGNSEVGHLNIGAGRIVFQDLAKINNSISDKSFFENKILKAAMQKALDGNGKLHLMGLVSTGGIHSHINHLFALLKMAKKNKIPNTFVHAFTDGRDSDPTSGLLHLKNLSKELEKNNAKLATLTGRYYAMDRDHRWERTALAYSALVRGEGDKSMDAINSLEKNYQNGITDEFIKPIVCTNTKGQTIAKIEENDVVICFNFRTDRCRQITTALTQKNFSNYKMQTLPLHYVTMTSYDVNFKNVHVAYDKDNLKNTLGEVLANANKSQLRTAETEKYPHVTFFFSGGRELFFENELRSVIPSPKVATYDLKPEMSAFELAEKTIESINNTAPDFICLNFANPDMVGHTGKLSAIIKAVETTDLCAKKVVEAGLAKGYQFIIIADHGNAETTQNEDGSPNTAHTTNPVPIFVLSETVSQIKNGILADVAPTILHLMGIEKSKEMTGSSLV